MAIKLGQLIIELSAKVDAFAKGMGDAKNLAFTSSHEIVSSLSKIGDQFEKLKFENAAQIERSFKIIGGVAAGAAVGIAAALTVIIEKAIETSAKLYMLSQSVGVNVETLSALGYAAKQDGVDLETLAKSLERLDRNMLGAYNGTGKAGAAFAKLHIDVKQADGTMLGLTQTIGAVADKFSHMPDGPAKTALAMELFGRGGAIMIPMLNKGAEGIKELTDEAERLGVVIDAETARSAKRLDDDMVKLKASLAGAGLQIMVGLMPALNDLVGGFTRVEGHAEKFHTLGTAIGTVIRWVAMGFQSAAFDANALVVVMSHLTDSSLEDKDNWEKLRAELKALAAQYGETMDVLSGKQHKGASHVNINKPDFGLDLSAFPARDNADVDLSAGGKEKTDVVQNRLDLLRQELEATNALIAAMDKEPAALQTLKAANEADKVVTELATKAKGEQKKKLEELRNTIKDTVKQLELAKDFEKDIASAKQQAEKLNEQADAFDRMADAAGKGAVAIDQARLENDIDAATRQLEIDKVNAHGKALEEIVDKINKVTAAMRAQHSAEVGAGAAVSGATQSDRILREVTATERLADAILRGADATRTAALQNRIEEATYPLRLAMQMADEAGKKALIEQIKNITNALTLQEAAQHDLDIAQQAAQHLDPATRYQRELAQLERLREALKQAGLSTRQLDEDERRLAEDYDRANDALLMGTRKATAGAVVAIHEYQREAGNMAQFVHDRMLNMFDGIENAMSRGFSDMIMGTKSIQQAFAEMGAGILQSVSDFLAQIVARWIMTHIIIAALSKLFGASDDDGAKEKAQAAQRARSLISADAAEASAKVFAQAIAKVPFPANLGVAPALAALVLTGVNALGATIHMQEGGVVPGGQPWMGDVIPTMLTPEEGVLTTQNMELLNSAINGAGGQSPMQPVNQYNITFAPVVQTIDAQGVQEFFDGHLHELGAAVQQAVVDGHVQPQPGA
jgi:hypothetical protein